MILGYLRHLNLLSFLPPAIVCTYIPTLHSYELRSAGGSVWPKRDMTRLYEMPSLPRGMAKLATKPPRVCDKYLGCRRRDESNHCLQAAGSSCTGCHRCPAHRDSVTRSPLFPISISISSRTKSWLDCCSISFSSRAQDVDSCLSAIQDAIVALRTSQTSSRLDPNKSLKPPFEAS